MKNPKISIIIPIYNAGKYLAETLDCLINQDYKNLEIIGVLDAPTDDSEKILNKYANKYKNIKIVKHKKNIGLPGARNTGAEYASGEYIQFMDSDALINQDFYSNFICALGNTDSDLAVASAFYEQKPKR